MPGQLKQKNILEIQKALQQLPVKKLWKINVSGTKIKVKRGGEKEYATCLDGNYITTDENWQQAFELVTALLKQHIT